VVILGFAGWALLAVAAVVLGALAGGRRARVRTSPAQLCPQC
jgi:hypothetical protein